MGGEGRGGKGRKGASFKTNVSNSTKMDLLDQVGSVNRLT